MRSAEDRARGCYDGSPECFSGESWIEMPAKDFIAVIKETQRDALIEAAEIADKQQNPLEGKGSLHNTSIRSVRDAIHARAKLLEEG